MADNDRIWHLNTDGKQSYGPYTSAEMAQYVRTGRIQHSTSIWREGWSDWQRAADVPDFGGLIRGAGQTAGRNAATSAPTPTPTATPAARDASRSEQTLARLAALQQKMLRSVQRLSDRISRK